jgi:hypothetical protein
MQQLPAFRHFSTPAECFARLMGASIVDPDGESAPRAETGD